MRITSLTQRVTLLVAAGIFLYGLVEIFFQAPAGEAKVSAGVLVLLAGGALALAGWLAGRHLNP